MENNKKGFTLIELLVVIGIIAVLATVVVLVINPAQLFAQARDSQRLSDLDTVRDAILFVQSNATSTPALGTTGNTTGTTTTCSTGSLAIYSAACTTVTARTTAGSGWAAVNFGLVSPSPLAQLPIDPSNGATYFYTYKGTSAGLFKLGAVLESTKYLGLMDNTSDGGTASGMYEVGTVLTAI